MLDCKRDRHKQLIMLAKTAIMWTTVQVEYEPVNPLANKQPFKHYLSAAPTCMFKSDGTITAFKNPYIGSLQILTDRIREFNAKFSRDKSNLRLAKVLHYSLKLMKYATFEGRESQQLPKLLSNKKAVINIQKEDERCFGYALLYFYERERLPVTLCH